MTQRSTSTGDQFSVSNSAGGLNADTGTNRSTQPINTMPGASQQGTAVDQARQTASQVTDQAKEQVSHLADQARTQVTSQVSSQKDRAAESLDSVAHAIRQTGQQLREQDQSGMTQYVDRAADQVERFSGYLRNHDVGEIVNEVERFARQQPALFVSGAFTLGLLAARFLKSSNPRSGSAYGAGSQYTRSRMYDGGYGQATGYGQSYQRSAGYGQSYAGTMGTTSGYDTPSGASRTGLVGADTSDSTMQGGNLGSAGTTGSYGATNSGTTGSLYGSTENSQERGGREGL